MYQYDIIYLDGHSGKDSISTNIKYDSSDTPLAYIEFGKNEGVHASLYVKEKEISLSSDFFTNLKANLKENSIVIIDSCNAGSNKDTFAKKIIDKGAGLFLAYDNLTQKNTTHDFVSPFLAQMLKKNITAREAIEGGSPLITTWTTNQNGYEITVWNNIMSNSELVEVYADGKNRNNFILSKVDQPPRKLKIISKTVSSLLSNDDLLNLELLSSGEYIYTVEIQNISDMGLEEIILEDKSSLYTFGISVALETGHDDYYKPREYIRVRNDYPWYVIDKWEKNEIKIFKIRLTIPETVQMYQHTIQPKSPPNYTYKIPSTPSNA